MDFILYCKTLRPEDWNKKVNDKLTVKDVIAHMVGWEKEAVLELPKFWNTKQKPWFLKTHNYDKFNAKSIAEYKNYSPEKLLAEWKKWQKKLDNEIKKIGEENLRKSLDIDWIFDEGDGSHYEQHYEQIRKILKK